jgi:hypothetical protein
LISKIKKEGGLERLQNIQYSALQRILDSERLNRMSSSISTLIEEGLTAAELLDQLYFSFFQYKLPLDQSLMVLQIRFMEQLNKLQMDPKLNPSIKSLLVAQEKQVLKTAKKRSKTGSMAQKNHYAYLIKQFETD